jgi:hypothetical protein
MLTCSKLIALKRMFSRLLNSEIAVGFFCAGLFWLAVLGWATSYLPTTAEKEYCYQTAAKSGYDTRECKTFWERVTSDPIALFTLILSGATVGLWTATILASKRQSNETKILQRAYLTVVPLGVKPFNIESRYSCDVGFFNTGNLPAKNVTWVIHRQFSQDPVRERFPIKDRFEGNIVVPQQVTAPKGARGVTSRRYEVFSKDNNGRNRWLYIWGEVRYRDGFPNSPLRFTRFCHRYNLAAFIPGKGIAATDARYHEHGNNTDESEQ